MKPRQYQTETLPNVGILVLLLLVVLAFGEGCRGKQLPKSSGYFEFKLDSTAIKKDSTIFYERDSIRLGD